MSNKSSFMSEQSSPVTVEAEYSIPGREEVCQERWTFHNRPADVAKDLVVQKLVPSDATLWRINHWFGLPDDH